MVLKTLISTMPPAGSPMSLDTTVNSGNSKGDGQVIESVHVPYPAMDAKTNHFTHDELDKRDISDDYLVDDEVVVDIPADGKRPRGWNMLRFESLKELVREAKGAASKPVMNFINTYLKGTKLIFVVGMTGRGKSTLLTEITGQQLEVGKGYSSGTKNYQICPGIVDDEQYLFVDTAGFGAYDISDMNNFHDIMACLDALGPFVTIAGALLVCSAVEERLIAVELRTIQWLKCICGPEFYCKITVVVTKWDRMSTWDFEDAWKNPDKLYTHESIKEILCPPSVGKTRYHGGTVYHHGLDLDVITPEGVPMQLPSKRLSSRHRRAELAQAMIMDRYGGQREAPKLQIVRELAANIELNETEAAKALKTTADESFATLHIHRDGFVRISVPINHTQPPLPKQLEACAGSGAKDDDAKTSNSNSDQQSSGWVPRVLQWLTTAYKVAAFFRQARNAQPGKPSPGEAGKPETSTAWARIVQVMRGWWDGSRDDSDAAEEDCDGFFGHME